MERGELLKRLAQVDQHISNETEMIARQRKMLAELDAKEVDTAAIQIMLVAWKTYWSAMYKSERSCAPR
jgi:hypothetical protein